MSLDFVAIDFETANAFRGSPCAVGLAKVRNGQIVASHSLLMRPPESVDFFLPWNTMIHGITPDMVLGKPRFADVWPEVLQFIGDLPVVAHNAAFDLGVIREACIESGLPWPTLHYACSLVLARRTYDLLSYSLPFVVEAAGLGEFDHHDAGADSRSAAGILLDIAGRHSATELGNLLTGLGVRWGQLDRTMWSGCRRIAQSVDSRPPGANSDADPDHPLFGEVVVFTGALQTMTRALAWERIALVGGQPERSPTKRTTVLVEGMQDPTRMRPGMHLSTKAEKARRLRAGGQPIELMGEPELIALLSDVRGSGARPDIRDQRAFNEWMSRG